MIENIPDGLLLRRIRRPLGAALSIGTTKITKSEGSNRSDTSGFETASVFAAFAIVSFNSVILPLCGR